MPYIQYIRDVPLTLWYAEMAIPLVLALRLFRSLVKIPPKHTCIHGVIPVMSSPVLYLCTVGHMYHEYPIIYPRHEEVYPLFSTMVCGVGVSSL